MHDPAAPIFPILDKSRLFVHLPTDPQKQTRRYLECAATGHLYCMSTGSLHCKNVPNIPPSANISSLNQRNDSCLLPSNLTPCKIKTFSANAKSIDHHYNGASSTLSIETKTTPKVKHVDQPIQVNSALIAQSNKVPSVKNAHQHKQNDEASKILNTVSNKTLEVKPGAHPIKGTTSKVKNKKTPNVKTADQPMQGDASGSRTSNIQGKKASKSKTDTSTQANSPVKRSINTTVSLHSNYDPTTMKEIHQKGFTKRKKKSKKKSALIQPNKSTVLPKPTTSATNNPSSRSKKRAAVTQVQSLCFSSEDYALIYLKNNFKNKTIKTKNFVPVSQCYNTISSLLKPFNRRPRPQHGKQKSLLSSQCKNCMMASAVHEIIHSRFAKDKIERMPESQIRAMLNSGDRKLKTRNEWIQRMEEEAINKYKKLNLEKHNQRLQVQEYDVLCHEEKFWLACSNRSVINKKDKKSWPLVVKCLHKYPDSTLRQASTHRSFCLRWNGTSYTLRMDHAYYTEIQCHMAITNTSYAELIVHTHKETTILPVYFDSEFWKQTEETLETFFTGNILPYLKNNEIKPNPISDPLKSKKREWQVSSLEDHQNPMLDQQVEDLHRCNLRFIGIPEGTEGPLPITFLEDLLIKSYGRDQFSPIFAVNRAARILPYPMPSGSPPRIFIAKFLNYRDRDTVLRLAREQGSPQIDNTNIMIFPDYSPEVQKMRAQFTTVKKRLREANLQYAMVYPSRIRISDNGQTKFFDTPEEVSEWLDSRGARFSRTEQY